MNVLHHIAIEDLTRIVGAEIAESILKAREGSLKVDVGGGGKYGRIQR
jgi:PHP family Zn ribbon phosphoesterase